MNAVKPPSLRLKVVRTIDRLYKVSDELYRNKKAALFRTAFKTGVASLAFVDGFYVRFNASSEPKRENDGY